VLCDNLGVSQPLDVVKKLQKGPIWSDQFLSDNNLDTNEEFLDDSVASISRLARSLGTLSRPTRAVVALVSTIYLSTFKNRLQVSLNFKFYRIHDHNRGDQLPQVLKQSADSKKKGRVLRRFNQSGQDLPPTIMPIKSFRWDQRQHASRKEVQPLSVCE
jgi:hypothetical protein